MYNPINYSSERESTSLKSELQSSESAPLKRLQFTWRALLALAAPVLAMITVASLGLESDIRYEGVAFKVTLLGSIVFLTSIAAARFRDMGTSGYWGFLFLTVFHPAGWIVAFLTLIVCFFAPSRSKDADQEIQPVAASHSPA